MTNMLSFFQKAPVNPIKGYKITDVKRTKRCGVGVSCLKDLIEKSSATFNIKKCNIYLASDGSLVDDEEYFASLPSQTLFIVAPQGQEIKTDFQLMIETFKYSNEITGLVRNLLKDNQNQEILNTLIQSQSKLNEKALHTTKLEHPEWFVGSEKCFTKEDAMSRRGQDRIRGYFYKTKDELTKCNLYKENKKAKLIIDDLLGLFYIYLNGVDYFSCIFKRDFKNKYSKTPRQDDVDGSTIKKAVCIKRKRIGVDVKKQIANVKLFKKYMVSLCTELGEFRCQGLWNENECEYIHSINPYSSRESLILFSTWNLDHVCEISRSILPSILENVQKLIGDSEIYCNIHNERVIELSALTYFFEIFTTKNLRLVNIICHDKGQHNVASKGRLLCSSCNQYAHMKEIKKLVS